VKFIPRGDNFPEPLRRFFPFIPAEGPGEDRQGAHMGERPCPFKAFGKEFRAPGLQFPSFVPVGEEDEEPEVSFSRSFQSRLPVLCLTVVVVCFDVAAIFTILARNRDETKDEVVGRTFG
jgi:hypothetical protein